MACKIVDTHSALRAAQHCDAGSSMVADWTDCGNPQRDGRSQAHPSPLPAHRQRRRGRRPPAAHPAPATWLPRAPRPLPPAPAAGGWVGWAVGWATAWDGTVAHCPMRPTALATCLLHAIAGKPASHASSADVAPEALSRRDCYFNIMRRAEPETPAAPTLRVTSMDSLFRVW